MTFPSESYLQDLADPGRPLGASRLVSLSNLAPEELSPLVEVWPGIAVDRRRSILEELVDLAEDNVELNFDAIFLAALKDGDGEVRWTAVRGLWEYQGRDLIEPLVALLHNDVEARVRAEAALALGRFALRAEFQELRASDAERVDSALRQTIANGDEVTEVRARAVEAVSARSVPWVHAMIREAHASPERRLRVSAVHAMGRNCDPCWLPVLFGELANEDAEMRYEAAGACGAIGDKGCVPHLLPLIEDEDAEVQSAAIDALGQIGGSEAKQALRRALRHPRGHVREAALAALAEAELEDNSLGLGQRN